MDREQAEERRARLAAEHPDRHTHSFILSESAGEWTVAKVAIPPSGDQAPTPTQKSSPEPPHGHDETKLPGGIPNWTGGV